MKSNLKTDVKPYIWSIAGPASVVVSVLLLVIKESPFYIDLSAVAMVGLLVSWRWKLKGALVSSLLLAAVFAYDFFVESDAINLWDAGVVLSIAFSFIITALASAETLEAIRKAGSQAIAEIEVWESKLSDLIGFKETLEADILVKNDHVMELEAQLRHAKELADRNSRLLEMSRDELLKFAAYQEKAENSLADFRRQLALEKEKNGDLQQQFKALQLGAESTLSSYQEKAENSLADFRRQLALEKEKNGDLQQQFKALQLGAESTLSSYQKKIEEAESTIQDLAGQLSSLADRLKSLQEEKDQLEKALDNALKPNEKTIDHAEGGRYVGLYRQLQEQFAEKKKWLDVSRRALFLKEEELLLVQLESKEEKEFDSSGEIASLFERQKSLLRKIEQQEEEILLLEALLHRLMA